MSGATGEGSRLIVDSALGWLLPGFRPLPRGGPYSISLLLLPHFALPPSSVLLITSTHDAVSRCLVTMYFGIALGHT